jgi:hypothetical protein
MVVESGLENGIMRSAPLQGRAMSGDVSSRSFVEPEAELDHRFTWRQLPPQSEGSLPARSFVDCERAELLDAAASNTNCPTCRRGQTDQCGSPAGLI